MNGKLSDIQERFDKIKDHRPKAVKKLNELGDILSAAYAIDPDVANDMWQYLVDLNVSDNIANAKFYIAQIFNKLTDRMEPEEATELLALTPERVRLMVLYGYDGGTQWRCLSTLIEGFLKLDAVDNCMATLEYFFEKNGGPNYSAVSNCFRIACELRDSESQFTDTVINFLDELLLINDDNIHAFLQVSMVINHFTESDNYAEILDLATEYHLSSEFATLLWQYRDLMSDEEIIDWWANYLCNVDDEYPRVPMPDFNEDREQSRLHFSDEEAYDGSQMQFYVSLVKDNDEILVHYFNSLDSFTDGIIYSWIEDRDWNRFVRYVSQALVNSNEQHLEYSRFWRILKTYLESFFYDDYRDQTDDYGRSYKIITDSNLMEFENALAQISLSSIGCPLHDEFHDNIKEFIQKASGNLDALNNVGFTERVDKRNPEQRLKDYIHRFLQSGQLEHDNMNSEYRRIKDAIQDEISSAYSHTHSISIDISGLIAKAMEEKFGERVGNLFSDSREARITSDNESKTDHYLERAYIHAIDEEIAEFYFLHGKHESHHQAEMITACIKKGNIGRAIELIDLLIQTSNYADYSSHNSWAFNLKLVAQLLANSFTRDEESWKNKEVTDEQIQTAKILIDKLIPYVSKDDLESVRIDLMKMIPETMENDEYICSLLEDVEVYITFPKPRGKGSAQNINRMSSKIWDSFSVLEKMGRLDVVSHILSKFAAVKDILAPVVYSTWMGSISSSLSDKAFCEVYSMNKPAFEAWLEMKLRDHDIIRVAEKLGSVCSYPEFIEFKNMVTSRYGIVNGLESCFEFTEDTAEPLLLFSGKTVQLTLDYIEKRRHSSYAEIHFDAQINSNNVSSVRFQTFKINGIPIVSGTFFEQFEDGGPKAGFSVYNKGQKKAHAWIDSNFIEDNKIQQITDISFQVVIYDNELTPIEGSAMIVVELDSERGYCVKSSV